MKVLIYSREKTDYWKFPIWLFENLKKKFTLIDFEINFGDMPLEKLIRDADVLISGKLYPEEFKAARRLRWVHSPFVGIGNMLFEEFKKSPVLLTNSKGINTESVATHAVSLSLALIRGLPWAFHLKNEKNYTHRFFTTKFFPMEPREVKVGIMGYGEIGKRIGKKMTSIGFEIICMNRSGENACFTFNQINDFLSAVDLLIITVPRTAETEGSIDYKRMKLLGGFLVNVGRGKVVVERDLIRALKDGSLKAAALDVFYREPLPTDSPLWEIPNLMITPHIAGATKFFWKGEGKLIVENLSRFLEGKLLKNLVNKKSGY